MADLQRPGSSDRDPSLSRRDFVRKVAGTAVAGGILASTDSGRLFAAPPAPSPTSVAETAVKRFYDSLTEEQRKIVCFPFDHPLRSKINANWAITNPTIGDFFNKDQQVVLDEVLRGVVSPDGYERFQKQMEDDSGGFGEYHVAVFGTPGSGKFEWELTGRHLTLRADGDSVDGAAFGGPTIYGHGAGDGEKGLPGNVFYYQTQKANEVFKALEGKQRELALQPKAPAESQVQVQGKSAKFPGITVGDLSSDQKGLVESVLKVILAPYRDEDINEALEIVKAAGGLDALHMAFYETDDLGKDQEWDIWRIEGPSFVCHFRGAPHVHAYLNVAKA